MSDDEPEEPEEVEEDMPEILKRVENIINMEQGDVNVEAFEALLFRLMGTICVFRGTLVASGFTEYITEKMVWMIMTQFYAQHLTNMELTFDPPENIYLYSRDISEGNEGDD